MKEKVQEELAEHEGHDEKTFDHMHERLKTIEHHLGLNKKKKSQDEALRERSRHN